MIEFWHPYSSHNWQLVESYFFLKLGSLFIQLATRWKLGSLFTQLATCWKKWSLFTQLATCWKKWPLFTQMATCWKLLFESKGHSEFKQLATRWKLGSLLQTTGNLLKVRLIFYTTGNFLKIRITSSHNWKLVTGSLLHTTDCTCWKLGSLLVKSKGHFFTQLPTC